MDSKKISAAFCHGGWRETIDAMFEATGLVVSVMDATVSDVVHSQARCSYCELALPSSDTARNSCFDEPPDFPVQGITRTTCQAGLPCFVAPVEMRGEIVCTVVVGGFVSSTRERKLLFEKLLGRGLAQDQARVAVREIPILPHHQVESLVRVLRSNAVAVLNNATDHEAGAEARRELELLSRAGSEFMARREVGQDLYDTILARAMAIVSADSGSLMLTRQGTEFLEMVSPRGPVVGGRRSVIKFGDGTLGRAAATGQSVLVPQGSPEISSLSELFGRAITASLSVPLRHENRTIGVLTLNVEGVDGSLSADDLNRLELYAPLVAHTINNAIVHGAAQRAMFELKRMSELAKSLATASGIEDVSRQSAMALDECFGFRIGGVVVNGWGLDRAVVVAVGEVTRADIDTVAGEATGRDLAQHPFESIRILTHVGSITDGDHAGDWSILSSDLVSHDSVIGYVFVSSPQAGAFDAADHRLLEGLAEHMSAALERAATLQRVREDLTKTITALSVTMDVTAHASIGHSDRVTDYAMSLGQEIGLDVEYVELLRFAGLLHDIGKTGIAQELLLKPSRLTDDEMAQVRRHVEIGAGIVEQIEFLNALTPVIMHHHECWNGSGYPVGLAGEDIPLLARILAIADAFDAMTSDSPDRKRLTYAQARVELKAAAGVQFDPNLVGAFLEAMDRRALAGGTGLMTPRPTQERQLPS